MASDNISLGSFNLDGIPSAPRGVPQIEVTFDINTDGVLNVSAKDLATSRSQSITITGSTRLSTSDIDQMMKDAEAHAAEDRRAKEEAETRNRAEQLLYSTDTLLKDLGDKVPSDQKLTVENAMSELRSAIEANDTSRITSASDALQQASYKLSEILYQQQAAASATSGGPESSGPGNQEGQQEDVIDAEFKTE